MNRAERRALKFNRPYAPIVRIRVKRNKGVGQGFQANPVPVIESRRKEEKE